MRALCPVGYQVVPTIWDLKSVNEDLVPRELSGDTYHMGFQIWRQ